MFSSSSRDRLKLETVGLGCLWHGELCLDVDALLSRCDAILQVRRKYREKMPNFDLCRRSGCLPKRISMENLAVVVFGCNLVSAKTDL